MFKAIYTYTHNICATYAYIHTLGIYTDKYEHMHKQLFMYMCVCSCM